MESYLDILKDNQWARAIRSIAKYGTEGSNPICEHCGHPVEKREGAHLGKTGQISNIHGSGRGGPQRVLDLVHNYNDYGLFCHDCHKAYDKQPQEQKDAYEIPYPDKAVREVFHNLKVKREAKQQKRGLAKPTGTGMKRYLGQEQQAPAGSQEQRGPKGGRYYFKMLMKWLDKEQGSEATDIIGSMDPKRNTHREDLNMEKNMYKSEEFKQADPFGAAFARKSIRIDDPLPNMSRGGQAIDSIVRGPENHSYDGIVKAEPQARKVYIARHEAPPPGTTLYRGKHGGRFYHDKEKIDKELNNLGNVGKLREVGIGKPDLPQNQGVFKGTNLAPEYSRKPESSKFEGTQQPVKDVKETMKSISKVLNDQIQKQNNPFAIATAQAKKMGYSNFKEGSPGEKKVDEISEAIKGVRKQNMPNPIKQPGTREKATTFKNKLLAGANQPSRFNQPAAASIETPKQPSLQSPKSPTMRPRGPRNIPFAQFSTRINSFIEKHTKK